MIIVLLLTGTAFAQSIEPPLTLTVPAPTVEITTEAALWVSGTNNGTAMICKTPKMDGRYMVGVSDCKMMEGHTLDEVMTQMMKSLAETEKDRDDILKQYRALLAQDIRVFDKMQRELNGGIPLKKGEPRS